MTRLSIADLEIERADSLEFEVADGTVYALQDPKALPIEVMMNLEDLTPLEQVKALIADDRWDEFVTHPEIDGYVFESLMNQFAAHHGLGDLGNAGGLPALSKGTAKRSKPTSRGRVTPLRNSGKSAASVTS